MAWHCNPAIRQFLSLIIWDCQSGHPGDAHRPKTINGNPRVWIACPQALGPFTLSQFFLGLSSHGHTLLARAFSQANVRVSLSPSQTIATCWVLLAQIWPSSNLSQQHPTCRNTMQHGGQTRATCCAQQCCDMLRLHVAIVWLGLYA